MQTEAQDGKKDFESTGERLKRDCDHCQRESHHQSHQTGQAHRLPPIAGRSPASFLSVPPERRLQVLEEPVTGEFGDLFEFTLALEEVARPLDHLEVRLAGQGRLGLAVEREDLLVSAPRFRPVVNSAWTKEFCAVMTFTNHSSLTTQGVDSQLSASITVMDSAS